MRPLFLALCCLGLLLTSLVQTGCDGSLCTNGYDPSVISLSGRSCTSNCDCNNQMFEGLCGESGICIAIPREPCQAAKGTPQSCKIHPDLKGPLSCQEGERICKENGLTGAYWGNCKCKDSQEKGPEPSAELSQDASPGEPKPEPAADSNIPEAECSNGQTRSCYSGQDGTNGKGTCQEGLQTCGKDQTWGTCKGEVTPQTESCGDGKDNDCDGVADEDCPCNYKDKSEGVCGKAKRDTKGGCIQPTDYSSSESCDGKDNDCNGQVDDGLSKPCYTGTTGCTKEQNGTYTCVGTCSTGTLKCTKGAWETKCTGETAPSIETCNSKDDDCDGKTDEDPNNPNQSLSRPCYGSKPGCKKNNQEPYSCTGLCKTGKQACSNGIWQQNCQGMVEPQNEVCGDGKDNDCDGKADESDAGCICTPGKTQKCYTGRVGTEGKGICRAGTQTCKQNQTWDICKGVITPQTETCDGKDNDCNGRIDDISDLGKTCTETSRKGVCQAGVWTCVSNQKVCKQTLQSAAETCDGKDNNCNGKIDEGLLKCFQKCSQESDCSPAYPKCQANQCIRFCQKDTDCDDAYWCKQGYCQNCPDGGKRSGTELCNKKDDNCNGSVDETFLRLGKVCTVGKGVCKKQGIYTCSNNQEVCNATPGSPLKEVCNLKDDDCNGFVDDKVKNCVSSIIIDSSVQNTHGIALDGKGNIYVADFGNTRVYKVDTQRKGTIIASKSNGLKAVHNLAVDGKGNVYVSDIVTNTIYKIDTQGVFRSHSKCTSARGIAATPSGILYAASSDYRIHKIDQQGQCTILAGGPNSAHMDGQGTQARFQSPQAIAIGPNGNLYITDVGNRTTHIRKISPTGKVTTLAGGTYGFQDGPANKALFQTPYGIAVDGLGNIYIGDTGNQRIRRLDSNNNVSTVVGSGVRGHKDGDKSQAILNNVYGVAVDKQGTLFFLTSGRIRILPQ